MDCGCLEVGFEGEALSLDSIKNNSHQKQKTKEYCPNTVGFFAGFKRIGNKIRGVSTAISCKSWKCPFCSKKNRKQLRRRIFNGNIAKPLMIKGFRSKFHQKFLTLTCPGKKYRASKTPEEATKEMARYFEKLIKALKKVHGDFMYIRVVEPQRDGFPHYHVLLVGKNIADKSILKHIRDLWENKYNMGNIDLRIVTNSIEHGVRYITKYLSKDLEPLYKGARLYSASKNALEKREKNTWDFSKFYFGTTRGRGQDAKVFETDLNLSDPFEGIPEFVLTAMGPKLRTRMENDELFSDLIRAVSKMKNEVL